MKKITLVASIGLVLAILSGIAVMAYANGGTTATTTTNTLTSDAVFAQYVYAKADNETIIPPAGGWQRGCQGGWAHGGFVEVSQAFEDNVINITKADPDVQKLLADGYNVTGVRPIIKATVEANGDVATKATSAIVMLQKDTTGRASVLVDVAAGKVTRIETLTRTVIEKP